MDQKIYHHQTIEQKWQQFWQDKNLFQQTDTGQNGQIEGYKGDPLYLLFAFAYPSGSGLHVGHVESKTALDILARYYRMQGRQVFFPVGWDAFGLPAENYAIKTGVPPVETTKNAINTFRRQLQRIGISYDWANELATCHPEYYKWTQWIFLQMYHKGLAYQAEGSVNWCPNDQTVLANEQVVNGQCERCGADVIQKELKQWYFKITQYQDELISGLDQVDWPEPTKQQQLNWIGRKEGININYQIVGLDQQITCFTTRPDTNFGATFIVLAPEHPFVSQIASGEVSPPDQADKIKRQINTYIDQAHKKTELERQSDGRKKSGVFTGFHAVNNLTGDQMPIWVSDFVLGGFGTGAVVGVPGHDQRDFEFAQFVNQTHPSDQVAITRVVIADDGDESAITSIDQVQEAEGVMTNSEFLDGLDIMAAKEKMMDHLEQQGFGQRVTTYRLRDWLISRQRYWGAPIPIVYDPEGKPHPVKDEHLPWILPTDVEFKPTGESPLHHSQELKDRVEQLYGQGWTPEYDTMDTFVDSSWYFLRYVDSRNSAEFAAPDKLAKWLPVDFYMIGPEHIVLHLLYSRFFTKFLRDEGYLNFDEPFMKMRHQGMILGPDGKKMSKSKGNVINPDDIVEKFGADTLRVYEMFMGPIEADKPWDVSAVAGVYRFLSRVHKLVSQAIDQPEGASSDPEVERKLHQTIKKVTQDIADSKFNTAIAAMMELINVWEARAKQAGVDSGQVGFGLSRADTILFVQLTAPFAPFLAEELYQQLAGPDQVSSVHLSSWPAWDQAKATQDELVIPVQINGKVRGQLTIPSDQAQDEAAVLAQAHQLEIIQKWLEGQSVAKKIYVPGRIINLVTQ